MSVKVFSLDGGGSWAMIQAFALQDIYPDSSGHQILAEFDVAVANSGGSLVLAGLLLNWTPENILDFLMIQTGSTIFLLPTLFCGSTSYIAIATIQKKRKRV